MFEQYREEYLTDNVQTMLWRISKNVQTMSTTAANIFEYLTDNVQTMLWRISN